MITPRSGGLGLPERSRWHRRKGISRCTLMPRHWRSRFSRILALMVNVRGKNSGEGSCGRLGKADVCALGGAG